MKATTTKCPHLYEKRPKIKRSTVGCAPIMCSASEFNIPSLCKSKLNVDSGYHENKIYETRASSEHTCMCQAPSAHLTVKCMCRWGGLFSTMKNNPATYDWNHSSCSSEDLIFLFELIRKLWWAQYAIGIDEHAMVNDMILCCFRMSNVYVAAHTETAIWMTKFGGINACVRFPSICRYYPLFRTTDT